MKKEVRNATVANIRNNVSRIRDQLNDERGLELQIPANERERAFRAHFEEIFDFQMLIEVDGCCMSYRVYLAPDGRMNLYWGGKKFFLLLEEVRGITSEGVLVPEFLTDDFFRCKQLEKLESLTARVLNTLLNRQ